jgi:Antitoxin Phd_YefM, type II toxin-antitoxin system
VSAKLYPLRIRGFLFFFEEIFSNLFRDAILKMKFITITELRLKATEIVREIEDTKENVVITKKGKPVVLMEFITDEVFSLKAKGKKED